MPTFDPFFCSPNHYGLTYLKPEIKTLMDEGMYLYDNSFYLGHHFHIKKPKKFLSSLINKKINPQSSHLLKTYIADLENFNLLFTYAERQKIFNDEALWQKWQNYFKTPADKKILAILHKDWQRHAKFAQHTSESLIESASILSELAIHTKQAKKELKQYGHFLPEEQYHAYSNYLNKLKNDIIAEKQSIAKAMCKRLELASQSPNMHDDVIFALEQQLQQLDISLPTKNNLAQTKSGLNVQKITELAYYIKTQGDDDTQQRIDNIHWFNPDNPLPLSPHKIDNTLFLVPLSLQKLIPHKRKQPAWFFRGHNQRCSFFQTEAEFLLSLNGLENLSIKIPYSDNPIDEKIWHHLNQLQNALEEKIAITQAKAEASPLLKPFRTESQIFFQVWQIELNKQLNVLISKKIDFVAQFLPNTLPLSHLMEECFFTEQRKYCLTKMLDSLKQLSSNPTLAEPHTIQKRLFKLEKKLNLIVKDDEKIFAIKKEKILISKILTAITKNDSALTNNDYEFIINHYKGLTEDQQKIFLDEHKIYLIHIKENLISFISQFPAIITDIDFGTESSLLSFTVRLLYQLDYIGTKQILCQNIPSLLNRFENYIRQANAEILYQKREEFWQFNILLEKIAPAECYTQFKQVIEMLCIKSNPLTSTENHLQEVYKTEYQNSTLQIQEKLSGIDKALDNLISTSPSAPRQTHSSHTTLIKNTSHIHSETNINSNAGSISHLAA